MKRILFVVDELRVGGVTSVLLNLLNELDENKYDIDVLTLDQKGLDKSLFPKHINLLHTNDFFDVCALSIKECKKLGISYMLKKIYFSFLIKSGNIHSKIKRQRELLNIDNYDIEIAFKEGIASIFVINGNSKKKINWIHSDYKIKNYSSNHMNTMTDVFSRFDKHVAVSKMVMESFKEIFGVNNICSIHNLLNVSRIKEMMNEDFSYDTKDFNFLAVGRLHPQKSYDRLLNACAMLNADKYKYDLYILGDGELKEELLLQKKALELDNVHFMLNQNNPYKYMKNADFLVLSSLYEGLPTVVLEAMECGLPVLSTRVAGVEEEITNDIGIITDNDQDSIFLKMKEILDDKSIVATYKNNLKDYGYDNKKVLKEIEELF